MAEPNISVELLTDELLLEDGVLLFSFQADGKLVECIADFEQAGQVLNLTKLHMQGTAVNLVGRATLWQVAYQLGRYFGAKTLHIEGGRRTTGCYKGKLPTPFTIDVPYS